jgi:hypothetical protein
MPPMTSEVMDHRRGTPHVAGHAHHAVAHHELALAAGPLWVPARNPPESAT